MECGFDFQPDRDGFIILQPWRKTPLQTALIAWLSRPGVRLFRSLMLAVCPSFVTIAESTTAPLTLFLAVFIIVLGIRVIGSTRGADSMADLIDWFSAVSFPGTLILATQGSGRGHTKH
jgi:hypothetical protein